MTLSRSVEDYLKAIYAQNARGEAAGTSELARVLDVQPASVTGMIKKLAEDGLLEHEPYRGVTLTPTGTREALKILRRHRVIETFLVETLGFTWDDVHDEAELLEHTASELLIDRMAEALGNPTTDPHGSPIPTPAGEIDSTVYLALNEVGPGARITVRSVSDEDAGRLRYFQSVGLVPGATAVVEAVETADGTISVTVGDASEPLSIAAVAAGRIRVSEG
ncbi:MAG: metal-dependent transcriptional regulator [Longimicrobiales bacterium]